MQSPERRPTQPAQILPIEDVELRSRAAASQLALPKDAQADLSGVAHGLRTAQHVGWALSSAAHLEMGSVGPEMLDSASDLLASVLVACPALQARWSDRMEVDADSEHAAALGELTEQALRAATTLFGGLAACVKLIGLGGQP